MNIQSLGYIGLANQDLPAWRQFSQRLLGTQSTSRHITGAGETLTLRMDDKHHRFLLLAEPQPANTWFGLELANQAALHQACHELKAHGIPFHPSTTEERALRKIEHMVWLNDPDGNRLELYVGLAQAQDPFVPDRPMGGFRTGELGLGHVVLIVPDLDRSQAFYADALGFKVSDYVLTPNRRVFLHTNARHHSVALAERAGSGIAHIMVEVNDFDDVGRAYDVALSDYADRIYSTLGRHSNDHMTSFYLNTPAGFPIEYGWGGRLVDDATWEVGYLFGPSLWGHDRIGGEPAARAAAREQRDIAYREGIRAPLSLPHRDANDE